MKGISPFLLFFFQKTPSFLHKTSKELAQNHTSKNNSGFVGHDPNLNNQTNAARTAENAVYALNAKRAGHRSTPSGRLKLQTGGLRDNTKYNAPGRYLQALRTSPGQAPRETP